MREQVVEEENTSEGGRENRLGRKRELASEQQRKCE